MSELPQEVAGETVWERAVNLAGLLAEAGVRSVVLEVGGERREVRARGTDLPSEVGAMVEAGGGVVVVGGVRYVVSRERVVREG